MESDESAPGSSGSGSSDSSDNEINSPPSSVNRNRGKQSKHNSRQSSRASSEHGNENTQSPHSQKSRSSSSASSSGDEDGHQQPERDSYVRQQSPQSPRSRSLSSERSGIENNEDGVSQEDSQPFPGKFRDFSASPRGESNISNRSNELKQNRRSSNDAYEKKSFEEEQDESKTNVSHEDLSDVSDADNSKHRNENDENQSPKTSQNESNQDKNKADFDNNSISSDKDDSDKEDEIQQKTLLETQNDGEITDLRQKLDAKKNQLKALDLEQNEEGSAICKSNGKIQDNIDDLVKKHDEDALDFEAEEGECQELVREHAENELNDKQDEIEEKESGEELEEGEVTDEDEKRPEETEPKPVCRFYTRGACTWGMSCRFLHPGVTDKGNYTMFDMIRPVPVANSGHPNSYGNYPEYRERPPIMHRPPMHHPNFMHPEPRMLAAVPPVNPNIDGVPPPIESAWERGLRTAKEMMRKANKRKEQDMDFEDKKMNLTLSPDELEKDNYYIRDRASPDVNPPYPGRGQPPIYGHETGIYSPPPHRIPMRVGGIPPYDDIDPYGRSSRYRELPPHRMPQYEDERRVRPTREVIVQRIEPSGRGDEWSDPWMRSKSPVGRDRDKRTILRRERSYSSNSSYSSTSSSRSGSTSESSRSASPDTRRRRYNSKHSSHKSPISRRHIKTAARSPSLPRRRRSSSYRRTPPQKKRHLSPSLSPRRPASSPISKRKRMSPHQKRVSVEKGRNKKGRGATSSSGSGSSDSSGSESESSYSSSSSSSSRGKTPVKRTTSRISEKPIITDRKYAKKPEVAKKRSPISIELRKTSSLGASALSAAIERDNSNSNSSTAATTTTKKTTRREELLKQLRAVEDAIARKKSKLS